MGDREGAGRESPAARPADTTSYGTTPGGTFGSPTYTPELWSPPAAGLGAPPYQGPIPSKASGRAMVAITLALASWLSCGILTAIPAMWLARTELTAISLGESAPAGRSLAHAAFWIAVVNVVFTCIVFALVAAMIVTR